MTTSDWKSIVDDELALIRARFLLRQQAERQRVQDAIDREASRAWWRAFDAKQAGNVVQMGRRA